MPIIIIKSVKNKNLKKKLKIENNINQSILPGLVSCFFVFETVDCLRICIGLRICCCLRIVLVVVFDVFVPCLLVLVTCLLVLGVLTVLVLVLVVCVLLVAFVF